MADFIQAVRSRNVELTFQSQETWIPRYGTLDREDYLWLHSIMPEQFMERACELKNCFNMEVLTPFIEEKRYFHVTDKIYDRMIGQSALYYKTFGINIVNNYERYEKYFINVNKWVISKYTEEFITTLMFSSNVLKEGDEYFRRIISTHPFPLLELMLTLSIPIGVKKIMKYIPLTKEVRMDIMEYGCPQTQKRLAKLCMDIDNDIITFDLKYCNFERLLIQLPYGMYCNEICCIRLYMDMNPKQIRALLRAIIDYKVIRSSSNKYPEKYHYLYDGFDLSAANYKVKVFTWKLNFRRTFNLHKNVERITKHLRETNKI